MKSFSFFVLALTFTLSLLAVTTYADSLGPALDPFAVLGGSAVTNASAGGSAATIITGSLGVSPGSSITGFPPGTVVEGTIANTGTAAAAQLDLTAAIGALNGLGTTSSFATGTLSGQTLSPGVYNVASAAIDLLPNSTLTLTGTGQFVFRMSSTLTLGSGVTIDISGLGAGSSVYWLAPGATTAVTLGNNADLQGNILANGSIIFQPGATDGCGRALSQNKVVSFAGVGTTVEPGEAAVDPNQVGGGCLGVLANSDSLNGGSGPVSAPEPGTLTLLSSGLAIGLLKLRKLRS